MATLHRAFVSVPDSTHLIDICKALQSCGIDVYVPSDVSAILEAENVNVNVVSNIDTGFQSADSRLFVTCAGTKRFVDIVVALLPELDGSWSAVQSGVANVLRSAAVNFVATVVVVDKADCDLLFNKARERLEFSFEERKALAIKALRYLSTLDNQIAVDLESALPLELKARAAHLTENNRLRILVVGNGGREHAIVWKLGLSPRIANIFVAPGNGGTANHVTVSGAHVTNVAVASDDLGGIVSFAKSNDIDLVVVGPEAPLCDGLVDLLESQGIAAFGPSKFAAQLEGSKAFSKDFMAKHNIPTAAYLTVTDYETAVKYIDSCDHQVVIKASGLCAGKGVVLPATKEEAKICLKSIMIDHEFGSAGATVVIEERLEGEETSFLAFTDGYSVVPMPPAQDHKRVFDNDEGPNTGGMGAYAPAPCATPAILDEVFHSVLQKTVDGLREDGVVYVGVLYAGLMLTPRGPKVLEFNCRFGDPETEVLLPLLETDLVDVMIACIQRRLRQLPVHWRKATALTVVAASGGYPAAYPKGIEITGLEEVSNVADVQVFHAGTTLKDTKLVTSGGRVLTVTAVSQELTTALDLAYSALKSIQFEGMHYRKDIAHHALRRMTEPIRVAVLGSTRGTDLQAIIDAVQAGRLLAKIGPIVSNREDAFILERARNHSIEAVAVSAKGKTREQFDTEVADLLQNKEVEVVLLIGYMRILSSQFVNRFWYRTLNVHPSLLPEFGGGMDGQVHEAVLKARKTYTGCTVHFVDHGVDTGPIAVQLKCDIAADETPDSLKNKVQTLEGEALISALRAYQAGHMYPVVIDRFRADTAKNL
eukprot:GILK01006172.1.p1 GENE.GILK01006172.1~~GILK01006172.1.p1  ORF type:complete len:836 (+),score=168.34 GILK01006172.1:43-2508(+)